MKILALLTILLSFNTCSFINIESLRKNSKPGLNTSGKILFNQQAGNTEKILGSASTLNSYLDGIHEYILTGNIRYGESFGEKDTDDGSIHLRYTREIVRPHFLETYIQHQYNKFQALTSRNLAGLGYRFSNKYFNFGVGAFHEEESIIDRPEENGLRGNIYLSHSEKTESGFEFSTILYVQPSMARGNDTRTTFNAGISQNITKSMALVVEYQNVYDQRPPEDIKTYDASLMFGLTFK